MKSVKMKQGKYSLRRKRDGRGDSGPFLAAVNRRTGETLLDAMDDRVNGEIHVGWSVQCGSMFPRLYGSDYWITTHVAEISKIEYDENKEAKYVEFITENGSTYSVTSF